MTGQMDSPSAANTTRHDVIGAENTHTKNQSTNGTVYASYIIFVIWDSVEDYEGRTNVFLIM